MVDYNVMSIKNNHYSAANMRLPTDCMVGQIGRGWSRETFLPLQPDSLDFTMLSSGGIDSYVCHLY